MKGIGFLWGTPIQIPNHQAPKPFVDWIPEVSVAPRPPHCSLSLHCVVLESVIFHNIRARKSSLEALDWGQELKDVESRAEGWEVLKGFDVEVPQRSLDGNTQIRTNQNFVSLFSLILPYMKVYIYIHTCIYTYDKYDFIKVHTGRCRKKSIFICQLGVIFLVDLVHPVM